MAEECDLTGLEDLESLAKQKRLSAAETRNERAAVAKLRTTPEAYREAAAHYSEAARIAVTADSKTARNYAISQGLVLTDLGRDFGRNSVLLEVVEHFQTILKDIVKTEEPLDWAMTQNNLGTALRMLGERENGTARLEEAVAAYLRDRGANPRTGAA